MIFKLLQSFRRPPTFRRMSIFVQKLNPLTGQSEWAVENENYDFHQEIARSAFADMLHDTDRNKKYYEALQIAIRQLHDAGKEARVLDIGTGTGLLSMMAAACRADSVTACEVFHPIAAVAKEVTSLNGYGAKIKIVNKRSTELEVGTDLPQRANILVTEVFDTELIGEGAIETFNHAKEHLLEEDAIVIPSIGRLYAAVIECKFLERHQTLPSTLPTSTVPVKVPEDILKCQGLDSLHDLQLSQLPEGSFNLLTEPELIFSFDFDKGHIPHNDRTSKRLKVIREGYSSSIAVWWELDMLRKQDPPVISCAPTWIFDAPWRDHWMQAVYYVKNPVRLTDKDPVSLISYHSQFSYWFHLDGDPQAESEPPICECCFHAVTSRTRLTVMNDSERWAVYNEVLQRSLKPTSVVLYIGDLSFLPLAAALLPVEKVYCVEESKVGFVAMTKFVKENNLVDKVEIFSDYDDVPRVEEITDVISEPYFRGSLFPWDNLRLWYLTSHLFQGRGDVNYLLDSVTICAVAVTFEHLHKIRAPLGEVEGFKMTPFDELIKSSSDVSDPAVDVHPLWEYPCAALMAPVDLLTFDLTSDIPLEKVTKEGQLAIDTCGPCNGVVLWAEWKHKGRTVCSGGPRVLPVPGEKITWDHTARQGVYFVAEPHKSTKLSYDLTYNAPTGDFDFRFSLSDQVH